MKLLTALEARALMPVDPEVQTVLNLIKSRAEEGYGFLDIAIRKEHYSKIYSALINLKYKLDRPWDYTNSTNTVMIFRVTW